MTSSGRGRRAHRSSAATASHSRASPLPQWSRRGSSSSSHAARSSGRSAGGAGAAERRASARCANASCARSSMVSGARHRSCRQIASTTNVNSHGVVDRLMFGGYRRPELLPDRAQQIGVDHRDRVTSGQVVEDLGGNARSPCQGDGTGVLGAQTVDVHRQCTPRHDHPQHTAVGDLVWASMQHVQSTAAVDLRSTVLRGVATVRRHVTGSPRLAVKRAERAVAREPQPVADDRSVKDCGHRPAGTGSGAGGAGAGRCTGGSGVVFGAGAVAGRARPGSVNRCGTPAGSSRISDS